MVKEIIFYFLKYFLSYNSDFNYYQNQLQTHPKTHPHVIYYLGTFCYFGICGVVGNPGQK